MNKYNKVSHHLTEHTSCSTIGEGGDTTTPSPGRSPKHPLPGIGLHDPLHGRQACPEFNSFHQGVGQICPRSGLFSCCSLSKRGQICYIPSPPQSLNGSHTGHHYSAPCQFCRSTLLSRKFHCLPACRSPYTARCSRTTSPLMSPQLAGSLVYTASSECAWIYTCLKSRCRSNQPSSIATATAIFTLTAS